MRDGTAWVALSSTASGANCVERYREGQEDQLGALSLVVNMIVLWNTIYVEAAFNQLRLEGHEVWEADVARLSPLIHDHINMLGRYSFAMPETVILLMRVRRHARFRQPGAIHRRQRGR